MKFHSGRPPPRLSATRATRFCTNHGAPRRRSMTLPLLTLYPTTPSSPGKQNYSTPREHGGFSCQGGSVAAENFCPEKHE